MPCETDLVKSQGHVKGPDSVHVGSDDRDPSVAAFRVSEGKAPLQVHLKQTGLSN